MANSNTTQQWQESKDALVTQSADLATQQGRLLSQTRDLEFRAALTANELRKATDPAQQAELQAQYDTLTLNLQQNTNKIEQNAADQARVGSQIERAKEQILISTAGPSNTNVVTPPASEVPGNNTAPAPLQPLITPTIQTPAPSEPRSVSSDVGASTNNVQVAGQWDQTIENLDQIKKSEVGVLTQTTNTLKGLEVQKRTLSEQMMRADTLGNTEELAALKQKNELVSAQISGAKIGIANAEKSIAETDREIQAAFNQQYKAESGPPNTISTPPPAGSSTNANSDGSSTSVVPRSIPTPSSYTAPTVSSEPAGITPTIGSGSTNNVQVASQWEQTIENLDQIKKSDVEVLTQTTNTLKDLEAQKRTLSEQMMRADTLGNTEELAALKQKNELVSAQISSTKVGIANAEKSIIETDREIQAAFNQQYKAESGPPNTISTPPPAGSSTNANSDGSSTATESLPTSIPSSYTAPTVNTEPSSGGSIVGSGSTNNVQVAGQWEQTIENLDQIKKSEVEVLTQTTNTLKDLEAQKRTVSEQMMRASANGNTEELAALQQKKELISNQIDSTKIGIANAQRSIAETDKEIQDAFSQKTDAEAGTPGLISVPPPAGDSANANTEGNNTDVAPTEEPIVLVSKAPTILADDGTGGFAGTTISNDEATTITVSNGITEKIQKFPDAVPPEEDPFEKERLIAEQRLSEEPPTEQDVIDAEEDPFERERLAAEQRLSEEQPTEQDVIAAGSDPGVNYDGAAEGGNTVGDAANENLQKAPEKTTPKPSMAKDWRVRISLAPSADYFYNASEPGILWPLKGTEGVIFPYTPSISVSYNAKYDSQSITHSNYNVHNYTGSSVDQVSISGDFTAQDSTEAAYMLAVIHFFRSATKMFYGKDRTPNRGTPPPLLYLSGHGNYQFDNHPMVLTNFAYSLPVDVDYINAYPDGESSINLTPLAPFQPPNTAKPSLLASGIQRLLGSGLQPGGISKRPVFQNKPAGTDVITRVPTKISISLTFLPIITRNAITNHFSLRDYANGELLRGSQNPGTGGGIW